MFIARASYGYTENYTNNKVAIRVIMHMLATSQLAS